MWKIQKFFEVQSLYFLFLLSVLVIIIVYIFVFAFSFNYYTCIYYCSYCYNSASFIRYITKFYGLSFWVALEVVVTFDNALVVVTFDVFFTLSIFIYYFF